MHRDPETTNKRAGGKGGRQMTQHRHGNTHKQQFSLLLFTVNFSFCFQFLFLFLFFSLAFILWS